MVAAGHRPLAQGVPAGTPLGYIQSRERDLVGLAGDLACPPVTRYYQKKKVYVRVDVPLCLVQSAVGRGGFRAAVPLLSVSWLMTYTGTGATLIATSLWTPESSVHLLRGQARTGSADRTSRQGRLPFSRGGWGWVTSPNGPGGCAAVVLTHPLIHSRLAVVVDVDRRPHDAPQCRRSGTGCRRILLIVWFSDAHFPTWGGEVDQAAAGFLSTKF